MTTILVMLTLWLNEGVPSCERVTTLPYAVTVTEYEEGTAYEIPGKTIFHDDSGDYRFYEYLPQSETYWYARPSFSAYAIEQQVADGYRSYPLPAPSVCAPSFSSWESTHLFP